MRDLGIAAGTNIIKGENLVDGEGEKNNKEQRRRRRGWGGNPEKGTFALPVSLAHQ